ncbi:zinc finger protein 91-like isoform X3 [Scyliorhinus canicula]|uniref:zinc finger protein 91-like isoform X3 n=1 Tax=Scyliorhinus canicula TaxID=7830 RepID=UPI0018F689FB|nr:zinc finger protein 91-like isoform X3 [Scyliorhinus canicula]
MNPREARRARSPDTQPSSGEDSVESNEIAFLVGEDGQLHSLQEESHKVRNPENCPEQKNGIESNRNGIVPEDWRIANVVPLFKKGSRDNPECLIFTPSSFQQHNEKNALQQISGDFKLPAACHYTAFQDSPKEDSPIQDHHSDDMVCNICGKRYKYMSSFWKHRRDHEARGELFTAFISRPDASNKNTTGMVLSSASSIKALISQKLFDRSGKLCPQKELNPMSESKPIMVKKEKASPFNSWQEKFHHKECGSVTESRLSVIKKKEAVPYCVAEKVSPLSDFIDTSRDPPLAIRPRLLPDCFFSCEICGKKYKYKSSFWKHIEDHKNYVVDGTISGQGWSQIAGSQMAEKQAHNSEQSIRKIIIDVQHHNLLPIRDDKQQMQTVNKGQIILDSDHKHMLYNDPIHDPDLSIGLLNTCQLCGTSFSRKSGLVDHIQFVHQRYRPHVCRVCDQKFRRPSELKRHIQRRHDNCSSDIQISDVTSLERAYIVKNGPLGIPASQKRTTNVNEKAGNTLLKVLSHDEVKLIQGAANQVKICRAMLVKNKKALKKPKRMHNCSLCGNKYLYYSILWKHKLMHGGQKKHVCLLCGSGFFRSKDLDIHFKSEHHQVFKFKCPHCEKGFNRPIDAQKHMIVRHTDLENFICRICNTNTETASELQNHIKKFHSPKVPCTHCDFPLGNKLQLQRHMGKH